MPPPDMRHNRSEEEFLMDPNKLTQKCAEALHGAQAIAIRHGHVEVDVEHVVAALVRQPEGLIPRLLNKMDVPVEPFAGQVEAALARKPKVSGPGVEPGMSAPSG